MKRIATQFPVPAARAVAAAARAVPRHSPSAEIKVGSGRGALDGSGRRHTNSETQHYRRSSIATLAVMARRCKSSPHGRHASETHL
jgi:hypothetical protein